MMVDAGRCARIYEVVDGRPRTTAIVVDGRTVRVEDLGISVTVDGRRVPGADLVPGDIDHSDDGDRLAWTLSDDASGLVVHVVAEADRVAGVVRTRLLITGRGRLERVELDRWAAPAVTGPQTTGEPMAYNTGPVGLGQPLFGPGLFAGIEHPVAENLAAENLSAGNLVAEHLVGPGASVTMALPVAVDLTDQPWASPAAVVGAGGLDEFWDYLDTLRPQPSRMVTLTNNWYHLGATGRMDEASVRAELDGFAGVTARHGLALDFVALDDGWEGDWDAATGLWGRMAPTKFPAGLDPLGPTIGLWLSPIGGYAARRQARLAWAAEHGYEIDLQAGLLCAAGTRYRAHLADVLTRWTAAGVGYWKLDGVSFACADPDHGHPVGPGARTAQADSFLGLVAGIRAVRPDAVIAFTIGSHPSPWWLSAVDFVWRGGLDDTEAEHPGSGLDRFDTYIDACLQAYRPATAMPVSALVVFSVVESEAAGYRGDAGPDAWARHCWLAAGRGTLHHDLYVAPDSLTEAEWAVLAEALAWARAHQDVLARSRMVLGDPVAGEVYGFAATKNGAAALCLRNPSAQARSVELPTLPAGPFRTVYGRPVPAGATHLTLDPFEVLVLDADADRAPEPS